MKDLETEVRDLDRRLSRVEAVVDNILSSINEIKTSLTKVTESQQALELKLAWAAGAVAIATIIAQIAIQGIFAFIQ
jgi:CII-binding regulator of phage lambda lysogenization HflD